MPDPFINETARIGSHNIIYLLSALENIRKKTHNLISLGAGLPDHKIPNEIRKESLLNAADPESSYPAYDSNAKITENLLRPYIAAFHKNNFDVEFTNEQTGLAPGSTAILRAVICLKTDKTKSVITFSPHYPLIEQPIARTGATLKTAGLFVSKAQKRWEFDEKQFIATLNENRHSCSLLYLNFPNNPTGYSPTEQEYKKLVEILLIDLKVRNDLGLPPMLILEDIAYANLTYNGAYYSISRAIADLRFHTDPHDKERLNLLDTLDKSIVIAHSFSKNFALAGNRVAYFICKNEEIRKLISEEIWAMLLTPSCDSLAAMKGALAIGKVAPEIPQKYAKRVIYFQNAINQVAANFAAAQSISCATQIPAITEPDAGFFSIIDVQFLHDITISAEDRKEIDAALKQLIGNDITKETIDQKFGSLFVNNQINNSTDAAVWLIFKANIVTTPFPPINQAEPNIWLRCSLGKADEKQIDKAMQNITNALQQITPNIAPYISAKPDSNRLCSPQKEFTVHKNAANSNSQEYPLTRVIQNSPNIPSKL